MVTVRLDVWLWAARFFKTRALAKQAVESGKVELAGQRAKPAHPVRVGESLQIRRGEENFVIEIMGLNDKRVSAPLAQALYSESEQSRERRLREAAERRAANAGYRAPPSKPDKRARRLIRALGDIDAL